MIVKALNCVVTDLHIAGEEKTTMNHRAIELFCMGMGIGAGIAILMAPKSGKSTRNLIRQRATDGAEYLKHSGMELRDKAAELTRKPTETINHQKDGVMAAWRAGKRAYAKAVNA